jgi:transposase-like protein
MTSAAPTMKTFDTLLQMMTAFPDEQSAIDHLTAIRWKTGAFCPLCGSTKVYHFSDKRTHKCGDCRKRFSIRVGTIFESSKIPLRTWFMAVWLITSHKKGIASTQLAKDLGVTQKTAWFMTHRLRHAARTRSFNRPLSGEVEVDETFIGGKEANKHESDRKHAGRGGFGKAIVMGMVERGGELRAGVVENTKAETLQGIVRSHVAGGANVYTDEAGSYRGLQGVYNHHTVNHGAGEYVRHYHAHTNSIESVWALLKRQIIGIHHFVSPKHLDRYVAEMTYRFNRREMGEGDRVNALLSDAGGRLTYKALIA